ncbi:MAG: carboxypeptidase regulatory-like domain-containing protein [Deltaproteobacteria bacterium]|nr:carboxypeptidase regulatory-like domain-containing protein [Deltaproteobacteria bacterium]
MVLTLPMRWLGASLALLVVGLLIHHALRSSRPNVAEEVPFLGDTETPLGGSQNPVPAVSPQPTPGALVIAGRVETVQGRPLPDVHVTADRVGPKTWHVTTDATGVFEIGGLPSGEFRLHVDAGGGQRVVVRGVQAGTRDLVIQAAATGMVRGTLAGFKGTPRVTALPLDEKGAQVLGSVSGRSFALEGVMPGKYLVVAATSSGADSLEIDLPPGATIDVALKNQGTGSIDGRVVDEEGAGIPGMHCFVSAIGREPSHLDTGAGGRFKVDRVAAGVAYVVCEGNDEHAQGSAEVNVLPGQVAPVQIQLALRATP